MALNTCLIVSHISEVCNFSIAPGIAPLVSVCRIAAIKHYAQPNVHIYFIVKPSEPAKNPDYLKLEQFKLKCLSVNVL